MNINNLVEDIVKIRQHVENKQNNAEIFAWLSDCQVYLENFHKNLEYTKQFIREKEDFKNQIISMEIYSTDLFDSLAATIKSVKKYEDEKNEKNKKAMTTFAQLNRRDDVPRRPSF